MFRYVPSWALPIRAVLLVCACTADASNLHTIPAPNFLSEYNMKRIIFMMLSYTLHEPNEWHLCSKIHLFGGVALWIFSWVLDYTWIPSVVPFALRLRQLTQIVSSSTPTGRMCDVTGASLGRGPHTQECHWKSWIEEDRGIGAGRECLRPFCVTSSYKSCTLVHNHIEEPSGHIAVVVVNLMLAKMSLLLTLYGLLHKQAQILTLRDKRHTVTWRKQKKNVLH